MSYSESQVIAPLSDEKKDEKKMKRRYETKKAQGRRRCARESPLYLSTS